MKWWCFNPISLFRYSLTDGMQFPSTFLSPGLNLFCGCIGSFTGSAWLGLVKLPQAFTKSLSLYHFPNLILHHIWLYLECKEVHRTRKRKYSYWLSGNAFLLIISYIVLQTFNKVIVFTELIFTCINALKGTANPHIICL